MVDGSLILTRSHTWIVADDRGVVDVRGGYSTDAAQKQREALDLSFEKVWFAGSLGALGAPNPRLEKRINIREKNENSLLNFAKSHYSAPSGAESKG